MTDATLPEEESGFAEGRVIRSTGSWMHVETADHDIIPARVRGKFRLEDRDVTNPVAVGDMVTVRMESDGTGLIVELHDRKNKLSRRAAGRRQDREHVLVANVDHAWCVQSSKLPAFNPGFVDRFLVMCEVYGIPAGLIINKVDLIKTPEHQEAMEYWKWLYESLGYPVLWVSAEDGTGIEEFREYLKGTTNVVAGASGVGKSSLINAADPSHSLRTTTISEKTSKGRHTTTVAELLPVAGGYMVDTPGIREFGIRDMEPEELSGYFVEMREFLTECRFQPCTHDHEPGCAVQAAVEENLITPERYLSYLNILKSLKEKGESRR